MTGAALVLMQTSAILYADFMNVIILGMHEQLGYTLQLAGGISSLNLGCTALGALAGAVFSRRLTSAKWCLAYLLAIALADALSMMAMSWQTLAALRCLHGLACGGLLACGGALLSHWPRPERVMGAALAIQLALASVGAQFFPAIIQAHGLGVVFLAMCATELATVAVVLHSLPWLSANMGVGRGSDQPAPSAPVPARTLCAASLAALFLFQFSRFMVVGYGFQIGEYFDHRRPFVGTVISAGNWLAGAGALIAISLPQRTGRMGPLLLTALGILLATLALIEFGTIPALFALATGSAALLIFIALPYHYGVCFAIDERHVLGVWTGFMSKFGLALGPAAGAFLLSHSSLPTLLRLSAGLLFAAPLLAC